MIQGTRNPVLELPVLYCKPQTLQSPFFTENGIEISKLTLKWWVFVV